MHGELQLGKEEIMLAKQNASEFIGTSGDHTLVFSTVFSSAFWIGLNIAAAIAAFLNGVNPFIAVPAIILSMFPAAIALIFGRRDVSAADGSDIWVVFLWLGLAFMAIYASGSAMSPLAILLALGPLHAISVGRFRLGIEASVFAAIGFLAIAALDTLGYGLDGPGWLGILTGLGVLIGVLQIGVFIAATRSNLQIRQKDRSLLREWEHILNGLPVLLLKLDQKGRVKSWVGHRSLIGSPENTDLTRYGVTELFSDAKTIKGADGHPVALTPVWESGYEVEGRLYKGPGGFRMVIAPVSKAIKQVGELTEKLNVEKEEKAGQARWVASIGHEIRNMLNPVGGYSDLMLSERAGALPEPYKEFAKSIKQGAEHLGLLIDDLMTATKSRAGHLNLSPENLDLRDEVEGAIKLINWQADAHSVSVLMTDGPDFEIHADRKALRQILINLLSNAIKYSPVSGRVIVSAKQMGERIRLEIRDHGEGMSASDLSKIGEPFFQGENAKGRAGTGLGLTIVRLLAEANGGEFQIDSQEGKGTQASVFLQLAQDDIVDAEPADTAKAAEAS